MDAKDFANKLQGRVNKVMDAIAEGELTLKVEGIDDEYGTMAQLDEIARCVPGPVELLKLEQCGHSPFKDQPDAVLSFIRKFMGNIS